MTKINKSDENLTTDVRIGSWVRGAKQWYDMPGIYGFQGIVESINGRWIYIRLTRDMVAAQEGDQIQMAQEDLTHDINGDNDWMRVY